MARKKAIKEQEASLENTINEATEATEATEDQANDESEHDEGTQQEPVALTEEQILLQEALEKGTLADLQGNELVTEKLFMLITVYTSLLGVLGADSPATVNALNNLKAYEPDKVKKAKKEKGEKIPKFNEGKEVRAILNAESVDDAGKLYKIKALQADERVSEELKVAITTFITLLGIDGIPEQAVELSRDTLLGWGKKVKSPSGDRAEPVKQPPYGIVVDGDESVVYKNRTEAVRALGYDKKTFVGDSKISTELKAWQSITRGLHSEKGEATYEGHTFKRVDASLINTEVAPKADEGTEETAE